MEDLRESNKIAFQLDKVYKYNLDNFIEYYSYEECELDEDDERVDSPC